MKKFAVILLLLLISVSPVLAARYMVPVRSVYPGKNYVRKTTSTVVNVEHNNYERNYRTNAGPNYEISKGTTYSRGSSANYGSNISPRYNYGTNSGANYNIQSAPPRTYHSGPSYRLGK